MTKVVKMIFGSARDDGEDYLEEVSFRCETKKGGRLSTQHIQAVENNHCISVLMRNTIIAMVSCLPTADRADLHATETV